MITEQMVEKAAKALCLDIFGDKVTHGDARCCQAGGTEGCCLDEVSRHARAALTSALGDAVVVPREPTTAMLAAGQKAWREDETKRSSTLWRAMWDAAASAVTRKEQQAATDGVA